MAKQEKKSAKTAAKKKADSRPKALIRKTRPTHEKAPSASHAKPAAKPHLTPAEKKALVARLLSLREDLAGQIRALKDDSLKRNDEVNTVEDGTDAYDRQFGLSLASSEQEAVAQINEALRRLSEGTYGLCEECQGGIEKARIDALPFVKTCIRCQSERERNNSRFRPSFGGDDSEQWEDGRPAASEGEEEET